MRALSIQWFISSLLHQVLEPWVPRPGIREPPTSSTLRISLLFLLFRPHSIWLPSSRPGSSACYTCLDSFDEGFVNPTSFQRASTRDRLWGRRDVTKVFLRTVPGHVLVATVCPSSWEKPVGIDFRERFCPVVEPEALAVDFPELLMLPEFF